MRPVFGCWCAVGLSVLLTACGDVQERFSGYPSRDTAINVETATPYQIADALSQMAHIAVIGEEWKFLDPLDTCTVHVIGRNPQTQMALNLKSATFTLQRDANSKNYYTSVQQAATPTPQRLFETAAYHDVFFAEGYLRALADKCAHNPIRVAQHRP